LMTLDTGNTSTVIPAKAGIQEELEGSATKGMK